MNQDFLTLEEAARRLHKSTQTIRRMIKKGELKAQRIKTPQGFHYLVSGGDLLFKSPIQNAIKPQVAEEKSVLPNQNENPTNQIQIEPVVEPPIQTIDRTTPPPVFFFPPLPPAPSVQIKDLLKLLERQHREKMALLQLIAQLQILLSDKESTNKKSFLKKLFFWRNQS